MVNGLLPEIQAAGYTVTWRVVRGGKLRYTITGGPQGASFGKRELCGAGVAYRWNILKHKEARARECDARRATGEQTFKCGYCRRTRP